MSNFRLKRPPQPHSPATQPSVTDTSIRILWP